MLAEQALPEPAGGIDWLADDDSLIIAAWSGEARVWNVSAREKDAPVNKEQAGGPAAPAPAAAAADPSPGVRRALINCGLPGDAVPGRARMNQTGPPGGCFLSALRPL